MSLNRKQIRFTRKMAEFQVWAFEHGYQLIEAESYRPPFVAEEYARLGKGIKNSVHTKKLARDLFLFKNGTITWNTADYAALGAEWKRRDPDARWGGDMVKRRDAVHFSFEHNGVW